MEHGVLTDRVWTTALHVGDIGLWALRWVQPSIGALGPLAVTSDGEKSASKAMGILNRLEADGEGPRMRSLDVLNPVVRLIATSNVAACVLDIFNPDIRRSEVEEHRSLRMLAMLESDPDWAKWRRRRCRR